MSTSEKNHFQLQFHGMYPRLEKMGELFHKKVLDAYFDTLRCRLTKIKDQM